MHILLSLFLTFLKVGAVSFGGGYGMISLLTEEVVGHGWMTEQEFMNFIAVAESTPGPIAINMATFVGSSQAGILGAMLATIAVVLPAFTIIFIIAAFVSGLLKFAGVKSFLNGIKPVVVGLIISTALTMFLSIVLSVDTVKSTIKFDYKALVIFAIVAVTAFTYKKFVKKAISPILLILISACFGMLFYGVIP